MQALRAADCHAHAFCRTRFPYAPDATYQPHPSQAGSVARFLAVLDAHGLTHGLLVGAEPHGTDSRCLLDGLAAGHGDPAARLEAEEAKDHVRAVLARLRDDDRQALVLRYALDWPSARIAEALDSTPAAVDMRLSRARKRLAELLRQDGFPLPVDEPRPCP